MTAEEQQEGSLLLLLPPPLIRGATRTREQQQQPCAGRRHRYVGIELGREKQEATARFALPGRPPPHSALSRPKIPHHLPSAARGWPLRRCRRLRGQQKHEREQELLLLLLLLRRCRLRRSRPPSPSWSRAPRPTLNGPPPPLRRQPLPLLLLLLPLLPPSRPGPTTSPRPPRWTSWSTRGRSQRSASGSRRRGEPAPRLPRFLSSSSSISSGRSTRRRPACSSSAAPRDRASPRRYESSPESSASTSWSGSPLCRRCGRSTRT